MNYANMRLDCNLPTYLIKSSIFGEYTYDKAYIIAKIMLILNILLIIISLVFMIKYIIEKNKNIYINILMIMWVGFMISMYIFNYQYPYRCSMDFRYIEVCLLPGIVVMIYELKKLNNKYIKITIKLLCYLFAILNIIFIFWAI